MENILPNEHKKTNDVNMTLTTIDSLKKLMQLIPAELRLQILPESTQSILNSISDKYDKIKEKLPNFDPVVYSNGNLKGDFIPESSILPLPGEEKKSDVDLGKMLEAIKALIQLLPSQIRMQMFPSNVQEKINEMIEKLKKIDEKLPDFDPVIYEGEDKGINEGITRKI